MDLSPRQQEMVDFIRKYVEEHGYPPNMREIGEAAHTSSTSVVSYNLNILQTKGYLERGRDISRGVRLLDKGAVRVNPQPEEPIVRVPILGALWPVHQCPSQTTTFRRRTSMRASP